MIVHIDHMRMAVVAKQDNVTTKPMVFGTDKSASLHGPPEAQHNTVPADLTATVAANTIGVHVELDMRTRVLGIQKERRDTCPSQLDFDLDVRESHHSESPLLSR